jgi:hypothetical protein
MRLAGPCALVSLLVCPTVVAAQQGVVDGHASVTVDHLPNAGDATELRARIFAERGFEIGDRVRVRLSGWAEGLLADRGGQVRDAEALPHEAYVDVRAGRFDLRAGLATTVWGRFDEIQPTDVINPLDISRFVFEGRGAARLPVLQTRVRWFANESTTLEGVWVPLFRRGRFDALDEPTSPFNILADLDPCSGPFVCVATAPRRETPPRTLSSSQGGLRVSTTTRQVDWSVSAYRGIQPFGIVEVQVSPLAVFPPQVTLVESFPRFTMIGADFETARGSWTIRGEMAARVDDTLTAPAPAGAASPAPLIEEGRSWQGGVGADRKAGSYRLNASVIVENRDARTFGDTDVSLVGGGERAFSRDTIRVRVFGVWNISDASGFARTIVAWNLRENVWLESSVGWFLGEGDDAISRFSTRDFVYVRLKGYF